MDGCSYDTFINIMEFAYNMDNYKNYASIIRKFSFYSKHIYNITLKNTMFLDKFYNSMFPAVVIPINSIHTCTEDERCDVRFGKYTERYYDLNEYGFHIENEGRYNSKITKYRCRILNHYNNIKTRKMITNYNDIYERVRKKYISLWCKSQFKSVTFIKRYRDKYEEAKNFIDEYDKHSEIVIKRRKLLRSIDQ